jgi:phosphate transport system substrate-binding protein
MNTAKIFFGLGLALSGSVHSQTYLAPTQVFGGGSSLSTLVIRRAMDCFGDKTNLLERGGGRPNGFPVNDFIMTTPSPDPTAPFPRNIYARTAKAKCNFFAFSPPGVQLNYVSTGSGVGISTFALNNPNGYAPYNPGASSYPTVHFAISEIALTAAEASRINDGTSVAFVNVPSNTPAHNTLFGRMIQIPAFLSSIVIAYDPVYKKVRNTDGTITEYKFNVNTSAFRKPSGGLKISRVEMCRIFNGEITNWNQLRNAPFNSPAVSLKDPSDTSPFSVPLQIVGRNDIAGTTSVFTRHLASVCGGSVANGTAPATPPIVTIPANAYLNSTSALPRTLQGPVYSKQYFNAIVAGEVVGKYTLADGDDGVAKYLDFTVNPGLIAGDTVVQGRMGYLAPSFSIPVDNPATGSAWAYQSALGLATADIQNRKNFNLSGGVGSGFISPRNASITAAFAGLTPPRASDRARPEAWVQAADRNVPLADPAASEAYPIVGTSNLLLYTCYKDANVRRALASFLEFFYESPTVISAAIDNPGILQSAGQAAMPTAWRSAIVSTFLNTTPAKLQIVSSNTSAGLDIINPGAPGYTDKNGVNIPASTPCSVGNGAG